MSRKIICGEITNKREYIWLDTPIEIFRKAVSFRLLDDFTVYTNNPQLVEALEVLCGEDNVSIYIKLNGKCTEVSFSEAYHYLGDVYDIINRIRFHQEILEDFGEVCDFDYYQNQIKEYEDKWGDLG